MKNEFETRAEKNRNQYDNNINSNGRPVPRATLLTKIIMSIAVILLLASGNYLIRDQISALISRWTTKAVAEMYKPVQAEEEAEVADEGHFIAFDDLLAVNADTRGWIKIPNTQVDNVIVHRKQDEVKSADDYYYLSRNFEQKHSRYGTLFFGVDNRVEPNFRSQNLTIHGHHMRNGQMFGDLKKFRDLNFYKQNPVFTMDTIYSKGSYKIFAVFITNALPEHDNGVVFPYMIPDFSSEDEFINFTNELKSRSLFSIPVDIKADDKLVTLSTCEYDFKQARLVVVARAVREGESEEVDVNNAVQNNQIVYPQIWYDQFGGKKPGA